MNIRINAETNDEKISELSKVMLRLVQYEQQRHRNGTHTHTYPHRTLCQSGWPRGLRAQNPNPHCQIFTSVSVDSSPRSTNSLPLRSEKMFTLHKVWHGTYPICDAPLSRSAWRNIARAVAEIGPKSPFLCMNGSPKRYGFRAGAGGFPYSMNMA